MKTIFKSVIVIATLAMMTSCGGSMNPDTITEKQILKLVNQKLEDCAENTEYLAMPIPVGTFECNDASVRHLLRQLDEAGIIDYKVTRYAWWETGKKRVRVAYQVERQGYWYSYYDTEYRWENQEFFDFQDHYIVNTKLTSKGKRLQVDSIPEPKIVDPELESKPIDHSKCSWNRKDLSENWPVIENPFLKKEPAKQSADSLATPVVENTPEAVAVQETEAEPKDDGIKRQDEAQYKAYNEVKENVEMVILKANEYKAIVARNIYITEKDGLKYAHAEVIYTTSDTNDAARILMGKEDDQREADDVKLVYYLDKGWVLCD